MVISISVLKNIKNVMRKRMNCLKMNIGKCCDLFGKMFALSQKNLLNWQKILLVFNF